VDGLTIRALSAQADVSPTSIYQHSGGKQQSGKDDSQKIEQTKDAFSTHFVLSCNDLCVQI